MKKSSLLFVTALAAVLTLASCGGKTSSSSSSSGAMTKADAVAVLNKIDEAHKATGFTAPTHSVITNKTRTISINNVTAADHTGYTFNASYDNDVIAKDSSVTVAKDTFVAVYYAEDGTFTALKNVNNVITIVKDNAAGDLKTAATAKLDKYLANATYAAAFAKYLGNFNADGTAVATGGTAGGATLNSQSYSSTGDGNLTVDINVHYTKETYSYDEAILYKWNGNLLTAAKSSDDITYDWNTKVTLTPEDTGATESTDIAVGNAIIDLL